MHVQPAYAHFLLQKSNALVTKTSSPIKGHPLTFGTFNMTFKGHVHLKTLNLASCMSIGRFLWSRNPNTARKWPYARSKVILVTFRTFNMTFEGHIYLKIPNLASCISIWMFFGSSNPNLAWELLSERSKVNPINMTFKGHIYPKIPNLASCIAICMFFGSSNPNLAWELLSERSKVIPINMTFKGHIYPKIPNLASCMSICMFFWSSNPNLTWELLSGRSKVIPINMTFKVHI